MPFQNDNFWGCGVKFSRTEFMTESQKKEEKREDIKSQKPETGNEASGSEDQKKRGYYYDDACGYEIYDPDEVEEEDSDTIAGV